VTSSTSTVKRVAAVAGSFALAWLAHFVWDAPLFASLSDSATIGLVASALIKGLSFLALLVVMVVRLLKDKRGLFHRNAAPEIEAGALTEDDVARLETFGGRIKARRELKGHKERFRLHHLMRAQLDLVRLRIHGFTDPAVVEEQRAFIEELRA
jgi:hypothetical protein